MIHILQYIRVMKLRNISTLRETKMVIHAYNPSTQKTEVGGSRILSHRLAEWLKWYSPDLNPQYRQKTQQR
jgi:hypothetical protein